MISNDLMDVKIAELLAFFFLPLPQPETRPARAVIVPTAGSDKPAAKQYPIELSPVQQSRLLESILQDRFHNANCVCLGK